MQMPGHTEGAGSAGRKPPVIRPGVAAVIQDTNGRVLLHRRRAGEGWAPLSGHVEPGENIAAAIHREILEETALRADVKRLVGVYSDPAYQIVRYADGSTVHFVTCVFLCTPTGGRFEGSDEGAEWGWFPENTLPDGMTPYGLVWLEDAFSASASPFIR